MDRRKLAHELERWLTEGYFHFEETGRYQSDRPLLKSYLVEADAPEVVENGAVVDFFSRLDTPLPLRVYPTDDQTIHRLVVSRPRAESVFFLDTLHPRFWILHTIDPAHEAEQVVRTLVHRTSFLDACWFPSQHLLEWSREAGVTRSLTAKFATPSLLYREHIDEEAFLNDSLYMRIGSRGDARARWQEIAASHELLASQLALWSAKVVRHLEDSDATVVTDITANGKFTSRGTSFRLHSEILSRLRTRYSELISDWETRYRLAWQRRESGLVPSGSTAVLRFASPKSPDELDQLVARMFNSAEPFRLFGIAVRQGSSRVTVRGVDLHAGGKIDFELTPAFIRCYLHPTTCGNVLARLLTNLQHFVDARINLD